MCGFLKPKVAKQADIPKPSEKLDDPVTTAQVEEEKKRRGFKSTNLTGGMGVTDQANIRKQKTGE